MLIVGAVVGSLIPTFLLSRLFLWVVGHWRSDFGSLLAAHAATWVVATGLGASGLAAKGGPALWMAAMLYLPGVLLWLGVDVLRARRDLVAW